MRVCMAFDRKRGAGNVGIPFGPDDWKSRVGTWGLVFKFFCTFGDFCVPPEISVYLRVFDFCGSPVGSFRCSCCAPFLIPKTRLLRDTVTESTSYSIR